MSADPLLNEPALAAAALPQRSAEAGATATPDATPLVPPGLVAQRWLVGVLALLLSLAGAALLLAWRGQQRLQGLEQELVRRQQDSQSQSSEARLLARQAQDSTRDSAAKLALLEARVAEVTIQRGQLEDLMQSLTRSRDENLLVDIDSGIRVAIQQSAITGSAEPLVAALKQADDRLLRHGQPRLEGIRRAIARDLDRVKAVGVADLPSLGIKLDEAVRMIDELPLLASAIAPPAATTAAEGRRAAPTARAVASAVTAAASTSGGATLPTPAWLAALESGWSSGAERVWAEAKSLIRVTRIDHPEAVLMAPENAFFVRENLKLRLLNARLALLSRQYDTAQSDLAGALGALDRYFDRSSRRTTLTIELVRQVAALARQVTVLRPDDTLAALASLNAGTTLGR